MPMLEATMTLLRYVPSIERGEFINIAVLLRVPSAEYLGIAILSDVERIKQFHADADVKVALAPCEELKKVLESGAPYDERLEALNDTAELFANAWRTLWQFSPAAPLFIPEGQSIDEKLGLLWRKLVQPLESA